jgi:CheY-like chemotaxis protein
MRRKKILVVDDDKLLRVILSKILDQNGFEVECAVDGHEALRLVPTFQPDLILLDVMMPKDNGYRISRMIKTFVKNTGLRVPVILLLTARRLAGEREQTFLEFSKADGMAYKPYDPAKLLEKIENLLTLRPGAPPQRLRVGA